MTTRIDGEEYALHDRKKCTLYIDESGDLGVCRGTRWFVLTGVIVNQEDERDIRNTLSVINVKFNWNSIHWRDIKDFKRQMYIVNSLVKHDFTYINVIIDTNKIDFDKIGNADTTYNYACRYLLERASWHISKQQRKANIILSARGTRKDCELILYIKDKLIPYEQNAMDKVFTEVKAKAANDYELLQLADICASSQLASIEINKKYEFTMPCFATVLYEKIYRNNRNRTQGYGIKYLTKDMKPSKDYFTKNRICNIHE
jgi:hypothetical protein